MRRAPWPETLRIEVVHRFVNADNKQLDRIETALAGLGLRFTQAKDSIMADLDVITQAVAQATAVQESAVVLISQIAQALRDAASDPAAVQALADQLDASTDALSAAVEANTPASPGA